MKAALLTAKHKFDIQEIPDPQLTRDTDVLIHMKKVGVCGSDIHYYTEGRIGPQIISFPFVIGHEGAGIVADVGRSVTRVKKGDRIAIDPAVSCGHCDQCCAGREHTCRNLLFLGCPGQLNGCMKEFMVLPEQCCFPICNTMTFDQAVLSEPLAIGLYATQQSNVQTGSSVAILGAGPIGMSVYNVLLSKNIGNVYMTDIIDERIAYANLCGQVWCGHGKNMDVVREIEGKEPLLLDVVFECCGKPEAMHQAIELLKPGGHLVIIGIPEVDDISLPIHSLRRKEITIKNIRRQNQCTQKAIDLLANNTINLDSMVTHHFTLDQTQQAFDLVANYQDGVMKAMITI